MSVEKPGDQTMFSLSASWYTRRRTLVSLGLLLMVVLMLFVQSGLADGVLQKLSISINVLSDTFHASDLSTAAHMDQLNASQQLVRISQLDPAQYSSSEEYNTWAYSACSAASMTEVFNAYGHNYRITDILHVEAQIGEITPAQGLLRPEGIEHTAAQFGFKTTWGNAWSLDQVIEWANRGNPVIVSFPPDRYDGGHILVVTGGNGTTLYLADSSGWNRRSLSIAQFLQWWEGFAAVVTPK
jgi:Peptidase_C39 like family